MIKVNLPTLFIYSKNDKLIAPENISKFIKEKKQLYPNSYLKSIVYDDPEHCMIYLKYPNEYECLIKEHIQICLCHSNIENIEIKNKIISKL